MTSKVTEGFLKMLFDIFLCYLLWNFVNRFMIFLLYTCLPYDNLDLRSYGQLLYLSLYQMFHFIKNIIANNFVPDWKSHFIFVFDNGMKWNSFRERHYILVLRNSRFYLWTFLYLLNICRYYWLRFIFEILLPRVEIF